MNYGIEFWRFIFTCMVCLLHFESSYFDGNNTIFKCGYLGVEFFFILSGFLMMQHANKKNDTAIAYVWGRIKKFYPALVISWVILILNLVFLNNWGLMETVDEVGKHIWEYLLLNCLGISWEILNGPTWYLSALLIASYFIYWLIKKNEKNFVEFIAPLLIFLIYSHYAYQGTGLDYHLYWEKICVSAIYRAVGGMSIGCILYYANDKMFSTLKVNKFFGGFVEIIVISLAFANIICAEKDNFNLLLLILFSLLILLEYNGWNFWQGLLNNKFIGVLGKNSLNMYLNQVFYIGFFFRIHTKHNFALDSTLFIIELLLLACIVGVLRSVLGKLIKNMWEKNK